MATNMTKKENKFQKNLRPSAKRLQTRRKMQSLLQLASRTGTKGHVSSIKNTLIGLLLRFSQAIGERAKAICQNKTSCALTASHQNIIHRNARASFDVRHVTRYTQPRCTLIRLYSQGTKMKMTHAKNLNK